MSEPPDPRPVAAAPADWSRLHPLTPLLRGGRFVLVLLAVVGQQGLRQASATAALAGLAVAVPVALLAGFVSWRRTAYRLTPTELQVDSGVLQRRSRRVPLARLQSVDVVRPLAARVLGLAELRLEVAGGGRTEAPLAYLSEQDAHHLRRRLLALAARTPGAQVDDADGGGDDAPEPDETVLVRVPTGALIGSVLLGAPALVALTLLVVGVVVLLVAPSAASGTVLAGLPLLLGTGSLAVRRVLAEYGFTLAEAPDGLRLRHGLVDTRAQTIPLDRVQQVRVVEPVLWRRQGWVRVEVDVAGYGATRGDEQAATSALLPVAPRPYALALVDRVLGAALPPVDQPVPRRARWRAPLSGRRLAVGLDDTHLVARSGILTTTYDAVPLRKVQSLRRSQGPWQRRLGLASVHADTAGRRLPGAVARHRDADAAEALLAELTARARRARAR